MPKNKIPEHLAIIMDGNGRWAKSHHQNRTAGHEAGAKTLLDTINIANKNGVKVLSVYAFSTENFKRPLQEVNFIMELFVKALTKFVQELIDNNIKIVFSGRKEGLVSSVVKTIEDVTKNSSSNTGMVVNLCWNYGAQTEIVDAVKKIIQDKVSEIDINEDLISKYLYQPLPPVDLLIRTSGEKRISNFMLWQLAYAEFYFTDTYWPDFNEEEFNNAIASFQNRERRYGGLK